MTGSFFFHTRSMKAIISKNLRFYELTESFNDRHNNIIFFYNYEQI